MEPIKHLSKDVIHAYKEFGCHIIQASFQVLELWSQPFQDYSREQILELKSEELNLDSLEIYQSYLFFHSNPKTKEPSGLQAIVQGLELELDVNKLATKANPLLRKAFNEVNKYRLHHRLPIIELPKV